MYKYLLLIISEAEVSCYHLHIFTFTFTFTYFIKFALNNSINLLNYLSIIYYSKKFEFLFQILVDCMNVEIIFKRKCNKPV